MRLRSTTTLGFATLAALALLACGGDDVTSSTTTTRPDATTTTRGGDDTTTSTTLVHSGTFCDALPVDDIAAASGYPLTSVEGSGTGPGSVTNCTYTVDDVVGAGRVHIGISKRAEEAPDPCVPCTPHDQLPAEPVDDLGAGALSWTTYGETAGVALAVVHIVVPLDGEFLNIGLTSEEAAPPDLARAIEVAVLARDASLVAGGA